MPSFSSCRATSRPRLYFFPSSSDFLKLQGQETILPPRLKRSQIFVFSYPIISVSEVRKMAISESNNKTVLITGINGYIASVLGLHLLSKGYSIRGTARKASTTEALLKGPYASYAERVKMYSVPDMTVDGAFDDASKGMFSNPLQTLITHKICRC